MDASIPATESMQVDRDAIISAANVLMVALLKMNRVLIPAFLKWRRQARESWIYAADDDMRRPATKRSLFRSSAGPAEDGTLPIAEDEIRREVDHERTRRRKAINPLVYTSVFTVFFTILTVIVYSSVIITLVLSLFPFGPAQAIIFSFSLVATATISEAETLLQQRKRPQPQPASKMDVSGVQPTAVEPGPSTTFQPPGGKEEPMVGDSAPLIRMSKPPGAKEGVPDEENGLLENSGNQRPYGATTVNTANVEDEDLSDLE